MSEKDFEDLMNQIGDLDVVYRAMSRTFILIDHNDLPVGFEGEVIAQVSKSWIIRRILELVLKEGKGVVA